MIAVVEVPGDSAVVVLVPTPLTANMIYLDASGRNGADGGAGAAGSNTQNCTPGGPGDRGRPGESGHNGRAVSLFVQDDQIDLRRSMNVRQLPGRGGRGGPGGSGVSGGREYTIDATGAQVLKCQGSTGRRGSAGSPGTGGDAGKVELTGVPPMSLFLESGIWKHTTRRAALSELLLYAGRAGKPSATPDASVAVPQRRI